MSNGFLSVGAGIAASVFLALYTIFTILTALIVYRVGWKTQYSFLLFFGVLRLGGQTCGVAFAKLGIEHYQWLIAYLVLSAEGYFTLVLTCFHYLAKAQIAQYGSSWIRPTQEEMEIRTKGQNYFRATNTKMSTPSAIFHTILIPANAILIAGGTMLTGMDADQLATHSSKLMTSKLLRCIGQSIFLAETVILVLLTLYVFKREKVTSYTMYALFAAYPFLLVRGAFGVMSIFLDKMNYFLMSNYDENGLSSYFVACEYTMATTMEFIAASILMSNYYMTRYINKRGSVIQEDDEESSTGDRQYK
ncbi:hypothetical protein CAAN1_08S00474 [[Candida] anglica]|uniref:DUF7702 domain-containing protein n=1 Tax=[Candida] anglica TaxID=148631 RepID=A0ABP0E8U4_9ASCO